MFNFLSKLESTYLGTIQYISSQLYDKITGFLPVIAGQGFGITSYINNILTNHLEQYKDDINELYEKKSQKPL